MTTYTSIFGGSPLAPSQVSYLALALTADTSLEWPLEALTSGTSAASIIDVTPTGAYSITMPDATLVSPGTAVLFNNIGASVVTVKDNGGNTLVSLSSGTQWQLYLRSNTTVNGLWRTFQFGASVSQAQASSLAGYGLTAIGATLGTASPVAEVVAPYTIGDQDRAKLIIWGATGSGTITLPSAASVGDDWHVSIRNSGGGVATIDPQGADEINGAASLLLQPGDSAAIICDGTNFYTVGFGQQAIFAFDFTTVSLASAASPYTLTGSELNRIAYKFTGVLTNDVSVVLPTTVQMYWVDNSTTGGSYLVKIGTLGQSPFLTVTRGSRGIYYCDGTNIIKADTASIATPIAVSDGGTGATTANAALVNLGGTATGISIFGAANAAAVKTAISAASAGANSDITSLSALSTPLTVAQGGIGVATLTGLAKGAGTSAFVAATAGTDYVAPGTATTFTAKQTFNGSSSVGALKLLNAQEAVTITGTAVAAAATINFDLSTQSVLWYNVNATGNPTAVNFRLSSGTTLNAAMAVGESVTATMLIKNGATAYFLNTSRLTVDTSGTVTVLWLGAQPTAGGINSTDIYSFVIMKTAATTWTIFASQAAFV